MFDQLAEELKQARIKNNISIQQLSSKTKIDVRFIEAMETGDFAYLPEIYVKAFTKQYAKAVGLDENVMIKKYEASKKGLHYEEEIPKTEEKPGSKEEKPIKKEEPPPIPEPPKTESAVPPYIYNAVKSPSTAKDDPSGNDGKRIILTVVMIGIIVLGAIVYFFFLRSTSEIIVPEKPIEQVIKENKQRFVEKQAVDSTIIKAVPSDSLSLIIQSKDTSWIKIILDDKKIDEFILFPGSRKIISADSTYKITFGNSGGIVLLFNNKPLNFTGKKNVIKYVKIDKNGLTYLNNPPTL
jgi:hypothetical protein